MTISLLGTITIVFAKKEILNNNMCKQIEKIYSSSIEDKPIDTLDKKLRKEINRIVEESTIVSNEDLLDFSGRIASAGEEVGFIRGFQYAVNLIMECVKKGE